MIKIFIGYDTREVSAYHVCANSIIETSSELVSFTPLALRNLKNTYEEVHKDGSNDFTYSRFLVPELTDYQDWALFIDGDMVVREDISQLWSLRDDRYAVIVVKHDYVSKSNTKYLDNINQNYPCKNWSSVVLWNCGHPKNKILTSNFVKNSIGSYLHRFTWLDHAEDIGSLPIEWNWLPDEYGVNPNAKLLHYTLGTPCFKEYSNSPMSEFWHQQRAKI